MICILGNDHDNSDDRESNIDFGDEDQFDPEVSVEHEDAANEETDVPSSNQETDVPPASQGAVSADVMERSEHVDAPSANEETDVPSANQETEVPPATEGVVSAVVMERSELDVDSGRRQYSY